MNCPKCNSYLSFKNKRCDRCGEDLTIYKKVLSISNRYYNEALLKAKVRDLSGAVLLLKKSLQLDKRNTNARNLLGLVYSEMGETVAALSEWVLSKHYQHKDNEADRYMNLVQANQSRLHTINQTIKKYNYALQQAKQGNLDLAVIQLKKVISLNPKYIRAYQLLALLYIEQDENERALKCLKKAKKIDVNNTTTLRYLSEVSVHSEGTKKEREAAEPILDHGIQKKEDVKYFSPANEYHEEKPNIWAFINLIIGVVIGFLVVFFLVVPTIEKKVAAKYNNDVVSINEGQVTLESKMISLENEKQDLEKKVKQLQKEVSGYKDKELDEKIYDNFFKAVKLYLNGDEKGAAEGIIKVDEKTLEISSVKSVYNIIKDKTFEKAAKDYYNQGVALFNARKYNEAIEPFKKALQYNPDHVDVLYFLGRCYHIRNQKGDLDKAAKCYKEIIEKHSDSGRRVSQATQRMREIEPGYSPNQ